MSYVGDKASPRAIRSNLSRGEAAPMVKIGPAEQHSGLAILPGRKIAKRERAEQALLEGNERLHRANSDLVQRVAELQSTNAEVQETSRAALNLMEDAVQSRQALETLNGQLRESEERYRILFAAAPMGVFVCDQNAVIQQYNKRAVELWGREPVCGVERHCGSQMLWLPDGTHLPHTESPVVEVLRSGVPLLNVEVFIERPDGSRLAVLVNFAPMRNAAREVTGAITSFIDISDRKQAEVALQDSERRYREMINALPATIYTTDAEGRITHFNPAAVEFSGRTPELGTDRWCVSWKLYHADGTPMPHDECPMAITLKEGRVVSGAEAIIERPDGTRRWFMPYPTPLRDADGRIVGGINMLVDITEHKQAEERQQLLMNELNHRVKNTLATVQSIAAQSLKGASDRELRTNFDARLISLSRTHDLLSRETWESASLRELLLLELEPFRSEQGTRFVLEGPEITVNPKAALALGLAFHELATNAAKYGALSKPAGQVCVVWDVLKSSEPSTLRLKWTETGGPPVKKTGRKGFGTIVIERGLSLDLDGEVQVDFNPSGLIFSVDIPLAAAGGS
jgi:PAS domain S-box-containing protein